MSFVGNKTIDRQLVLGESVECFVLQLEMSKNATEVTRLRQRKTRRSWCWFFELCFEFISDLHKTRKQHLSRMLLKRMLQKSGCVLLRTWLNTWRYGDFTMTTQEYLIPKLIPSWWFQPIWKISIRQIASFPQVGVKINHIWNHHRFKITPRSFADEKREKINRKRGCWEKARLFHGQILHEAAMSFQTIHHIKTEWSCRF